MLEKHSDSGEFDGAGRSDSCNEDGDDSDDEAASANGSRSSPGDDNGTSGSGIPGVGISPENFDPTVIFLYLENILTNSSRACQMHPKYQNGFFSFLQKTSFMPHFCSLALFSL